MKGRLHKETRIPRYKLDRDHNHLREIQKRVRRRLCEVHPRRFYVMQFKVVFFPLLYIALYFCTLNAYPDLFSFYFGYFLMGLFLVVIFLTVIHEVVHDNVFRKKSWNQFFMYFFDILGANSFIWKKRHRIMHHNFPNLKGWDTDIEQSTLFKIHPDKHHTKYHSVQHYLMFILYPLYLFNWMLIRDFRDLFSRDRIIHKMIKVPAIEYVKFFFFKFYYIFYMFFVPWYFYRIPFTTVFAGFLLLTFTASVFALAVLLPPHAILENEFPEINKDLEVPSTWIEHQLRTTSDISTHNWFIAFFMGNFNYHVAHHIFPNLSYIYMKEATVEIANYAREHRMPYKQYTFLHALKKHYQLVRANAHNKSIFEETF